MAFALRGEWDNVMNPSTGAPRRIVISWVPGAERSANLASALDGESITLAWAPQGGSRVRKLGSWARSAPATARIVRSLPPGSLAVLMTPPVFSPLCALAARRPGTMVVLDMHSAAVDSPKWKWTAPLLRSVLRRADAVIVTNPGILGSMRTSTSAEQIVIVDPALGAVAPHALGRVAPTPEGRPTVVFPASGHADEPLDALRAAADLLADEVSVVVTGAGDPARVRAPLVATGYLSRADFEETLASATLVLALTDRENTNQRAASEALRLGKPIVCSATEMLRETYGGAAVFVDNSPTSIAEGIRAALRDLEGLAERLPAVRERVAGQSRDGVARLVALAPSAVTRGS